MKKGDKQAKNKPSETFEERAKVKADRIRTYKRPRKGQIETGKTNN